MQGFVSVVSAVCVQLETTTTTTHLMIKVVVVVVEHNKGYSVPHRPQKKRGRRLLLWTSRRDVEG